MSNLRLELSTGVVDVYDNIVPKHLALKVNNFLVDECGYFIGWKDQTDKDPHLHAVLPDANRLQFDLIGLLEDRPEMLERFKGLKKRTTIANLSTASSIHHVHAHPHDDLVILYYANLEWQDHWEGETMFFAEDGEIELTSKYTPGRIIVFDAKMPHTIRAQSPAGPPFRFSISMFWEKSNEPKKET
jgi:hypothetical protein